MKTLLRTSLLFSLASGCTPPDDDEAVDTQASETGNQDDTAGEVDSAVEPEVEEPHPLGGPVSDFSLTDINPSSATYEQSLSSVDLAGQAYSIIFLDSRCNTCIDVIEDLWSTLGEHPSRSEALPLYAIQSVAGSESEETVERMIIGHDMPYLQDTAEVGLWQAYEALNHDFFAVSAEGTLDVWLPLYMWPDDLQLYLDYMNERFGS